MVPQNIFITPSDQWHGFSGAILLQIGTANGCLSYPVRSLTGGNSAYSLLAWIRELCLMITVKSSSIISGGNPKALPHSFR
jgi:hypothetical protein